MAWSQDTYSTTWLVMESGQGGCSLHYWETPPKTSVVQTPFWARPAGSTAQIWPENFLRQNKFLCLSSEITSLIDMTCASVSPLQVEALYRAKVQYSPYSASTKNSRNWKIARSRTIWWRKLTIMSQLAVSLHPKDPASTSIGLSAEPKNRAWPQSTLGSPPLRLYLPNRLRAIR